MLDNQHETLFHRHPQKPDSVGGAMALRHQHRLQIRVQRVCRTEQPCSCVASRTAVESRTSAPRARPTVSTAGPSIRRPRCCRRMTTPRKRGVSRIRALPMWPSWSGTSLSTPPTPAPVPACRWRPRRTSCISKRFGSIMMPEDKDAALFPRRFGDYWALVHRPPSPLGAHIWMAYSPDLRHWGSHHLILAARRGPGGMRTRSGWQRRPLKRRKVGC